MGLIDADVSFCKDPQEVDRVKKFLKEHVSKEERQRAKAVKLIDRAESDPCTTESELLGVHNARLPDTGAKAETSVGMPQAETSTREGR